MEMLPRIDSCLLNANRVKAAAGAITCRRFDTYTT